MWDTEGLPPELKTEDQRDKLGWRIVEFWTPPKGNGPKSQQRLRTLIREIIKRYPGASPREIYKVLDDHISVRCHWSLSRHIREFVKEEGEKAIEDGRLKLTYEEREKRRRAQWTARQSNARVTKRLAEALGCSVRYASMLRKEGTTILETAQKMAETLGTTVDDHLREKSRTGRQTDFPSWFLKLAAPGGSFRDFVRDDQLKSSRRAEILVTTLREMKGDAWIQLAEVDTLEGLLQFCVSFKITHRPEVAVIETWTEFKLWKIELVSALATRMVKENLRADSFHSQDQLTAGNG